MCIFLHGHGSGPFCDDRIRNQGVSRRRFANRTQ
jgi:hypothetical protein